MGKNPTVLAFIVTRGIIAVIYTASLASSATNEFVVPSDVGCICSGSVVTYECRIVGAGNTQWTGSLFDCVENGIVLRHNRFSSGGVVGECNQGAVTARSIGVDNNCYASQLTFTADVAFNNKTVVCIHNAIGNVMIGMSMLTIIGDSYPPPENVILTSIRQHMLTFSWTPSATMCTLLVYNITSNCGSCPASSNTTTAKCTNLQVSSRESNCTFSVHSMVTLCSTIGRASIPVVLGFKVPDAPRVTIVPVYNSSDIVTRVSTRIDQTNFSNLTINSGEIGVVDEYNTYVNNKPVATNSSCLRDECEYLIDLPLDICYRQADVSVNISALNELGESSASGPINFGCRNEFVRLEYDPATKTITCQFQGMLDTSTKFCSVQYGVCGDELNKTVVNSTISDAVTLMLRVLESDGSDRDYCYTVTAISGTRTVMIEGSTARNGQPFPVTAVVVPIVVVVTIMLIILLAVGITFVIRQNLRDKKEKSDDSEELSERDKKDPSISNDALHSQDLRPYDQSEVVIVQYDVETDCSLGEFLAQKGLTLKRGCVLCQFIKVETVAEDMLLLFRNKTTGNYFTLDKESDVYKQLLGDRVMRPSFSGYFVFFQSQDGGKRHLQGGSKILYMFTNLWCIERGKFDFVSPAIINVDLKAIGKRKGVDFSKHNFYFASESSTEEDQKSVANIVLENVETKALLTGHHTRSIIQQSELDKSQWRVYVLEEYKDNMTVPRETYIMYEVDEIWPTLTSKVPLVCTPIRPNQFEMKEVPMDCNELRQTQQIFYLNPDEPVFIEIGSIEAVDAEIIDVVITDKEMQTWFTSPLSVNYFNTLKKESTQKEMMVFIMCTSSKASFQIPEQSRVLYNGLVKKHLRVPFGLLPIRSHHFVSVAVTKGSMINKVIKRQRLKKDCAIFFELDSVEDPPYVRDAILIEKKDEHKNIVGAVVAVLDPLYTGPLARNKFRSFTENSGSRRSLVLYCENPSLQFTRDCNVYYQKPGVKQRFIVLIADKDNIRLSDFVETELKDTNEHFVFNSSEAFYELREEEDLLYFREIVVMKAPWNYRRAKNIYPTHREIADCLYESFYKISEDPPGFEQNPSKTERNTKRFIQSLSQGSRCLKKKDIVLYRVGDDKNIILA